ncbi:MAG: hydrolase [Melioribacteraceae bacterium]|nr:hydrolase [Melioribacteraceae bacterium]MCF8355881.1 hydrolase [Melioribacteraceae bacterium]MCF8395210.1 hydrolase [Melioribacteraceae bacterium]MCF8420684.1 hydrolase [Melioribacteraceae bacterium]
METKRHEKILNREKTALLIIDIQERILKVINEYERVVDNTIKLIKGMKELNVPIYYTEQYPKGLGTTVSEIKEELQDSDAIHKMSFSCSGAGELFKELIDKNITQVVVCGIESHVCVQQTVLDLLANSFQVDVAADAVSSRRKFDFEIALDRMRNLGAEVTTTESILFELLNVCGTPEFKAVSKIVK